MHRYDELEKLYYKTKIKKYSLAVIGVLFVLGAGIYGYKSLSTKKNSSKAEIKVDFKKITSKENKDINVSENKAVKNSEKAVINKENSEYNKTKDFNNINKISSAKKTEKKEESLTPNLSFVVPKIKDDELKAHNSNNQKEKKVSKSEKKVTKIKENKSQINIIPVIKEEKINLNELISSFNKEPKYDTAMVISKYYYDKNDFKNAKLWALKANNIDPSKYESWKMFALILLKKNDKIKAKEVLKIYLNDYGDNDEIYKLLRSIDE